MLELYVDIHTLLGAMKYTRQHAGKWVAVKDNKVIATSKEFAPLRKKMNARKDVTKIRFALVPKGLITGLA